MLVSLIAAVSDDGIIARGGRIPWHLPADVRHFRKYTDGKWLLLGRSTFEQMRGWFSGHTPLVLSRGAAFRLTDGPGTVVRSMEQALQLAASAGAPEVVVCGGAQAYAAALPFATLLILTTVHGNFGPGVPFPPFHPGEWLQESCATFPNDNENPHPHTIRQWRRLRPARPYS